MRVKDLDNHSVRALLASRALLVKIKRDLENQIRGLLKNFGLVIGRAKFNVFTVRTEELIEVRLVLTGIVAIGLAASLMMPDTRKYGYFEGTGQAERNL